MPRFRFSSFVVDTDTVEIIGPDGVRDVEPQVFDVLRYLVEQRGRMVTKEELLDNVWGDRFVSESALTTRIKQARRAIDDDGTTQWAIKTVHGRGYRFVPEVVEAGAESTTVSTPTAPPAAALPAELVADTRHLFCGREHEVRMCTELLRRVEAEHTFGWLWVLGEPGIGKTRLAAEVARLATDRGHRVLFGRNSEDLRVPYQPFVEVIRQISAASSNSATVPAALAPLMPNQATTPTPTPPTPAARGGALIDDESLRFEMFEAVGDWLAEQTTTGPLVIIIDDVHWAAESTLQLLGYLQRRPTGAAVTFVLTSRDTAPDVNSKVSDLVASAPGHAATAIVRLSGLSVDEAARLIGDQSGLDMAAVMQQSAGNPLFLQAIDPSDGSVDIESAVRRRLNRLSERVQDSLRLVSVLGLEFELKVAAVANNLDELDLLDDLEAAIAAHLVDDVGVDRFRFTHALVRSSLRNEISSARRSRLHARIADAIHSVFGSDPRYLPELAFHTAEAAMSDPALRPIAVERLRRAAVESSAQFSFAEAAASLERARLLADPTDIQTLAALVLAQGVAEHRGGENVIAARTFSEAIGLARQAGDVTGSIEAALRYEDAMWRPGLPGTDAFQRIDDAVTMLDEALASGSHIDNELELRARLAASRFRALAMSNRRGDMDAAFDDAWRLAVEVGSPTVEAVVLSVYLGQVTYFEQGETTRAAVRRLAELEPAIDDIDVAMRALHDRSVAAMTMGDFDERRAILRRFDELHARSQSTFWQFVRANLSATDAFYRGDLDEAERLAERCLEAAQQLPEEDGSGTYGLRMFMIRREQDRLGAMVPLVKHVLARSPGATYWTPGLALLLLETDQPGEAAEVLSPVRAAGFDLPVDATWSTVMVLLIESMVQLGDRDACRILRDRFAGYAGMNVTTGSGLMCFGRAERYLGMLAYTVGELDVAEEFLGVALEGDSAGGSTLWSNESRLWLSRVRRAQGHTAEADAMVAVVAAEAEGAGLARLSRLATADSGR